MPEENIIEKEKRKENWRMYPSSRLLVKPVYF